MLLSKCVRLALLLGISGISSIAMAQNLRIDSLRQALSSLSRDDEKYVHTLWQAMNAHVQTDNRQAALYAGEAYEICQARFHELQNQAGLNFAERLVYIELLDSAESLLNEFYDSFSSSPTDSAALIRYYLTRGSIAHRRTKIKDAGDFYNSALKTAFAIDDRKGTGLALLRLGSLYHRQRMDSLALEYYTQALPVYKDLKMESGMASIYSNLSTIYSYLGSYKYSDLYMDSALSIEERQGKVEGLISSYGNVVIDAVDRRKDFARAARYLEKLNNAVTLTSAPRSLGFAANVTATYHIAIGNFATARDAALIAYRIGRENKIRFVLSNAYQNLVQANEGLRQFEDAFVHQKEWNAFKDSINQVEQENAIVELKTQYETEKKEAENQRLLLANEQQEKLNLILGGGGLLLLMLSGSLFYFYRGKQKANRKLVTQKRQIESNLNEKEALLREIHHRVKNNLQVISSLLNMQSYHLNDPGMINAIAEGQSRVKAMALIHQKLYQTEQLTEIDFEEYTNQLINHLATAFGQPDKKINRKVSGANIKLDIDTAIPLGLILNELVTNAYKYAFEGVNEGDIAIELQRVDDHQYKLTVADSGKGLPGDFEVTKLNSLGLKLVNMLIEQLDGQLTIQSENGTQFSIRFKEAKMSA